jgi:hypothetical protein
MAKRQKPKEGDIISLPVEEKYAIGLITRIDEDNTPLGYFYEQLFNEPVISFDKLNFHEPILIKRFGSQGFNDNTWKILGCLPNFKRSDFPVPVFFTHTKPFKPELVYFDDNMNEIKRHTIEESEAEKYKDNPKTGLGGSGFIEKILRRIIIEKIPSR